MLTPMRILVVEDEAGMAKALVRGLSAEGFAVDHAADGVSGQELALFGEYDLVLLDIMLPGRSGYDIVKNLRAADVWTPVLLLSAKDGEYDIADGLDLGADDYLTKPFSFVELVARVRALTRRRAEKRPTQLTAGEVMLDPASRTVTAAGADVELTSREFALLEYLMRRSGSVIGKAELRDHVFQMPGDDLNVVEVYVGYLRRKLGADVIETVRGFGYKVRSGD